METKSDWSDTETAFIFILIFNLKRNLFQQGKKWIFLSKFLIISIQLI